MMQRKQVTEYSVFFFLAAPSGLRDLSSPTRDRTHALRAKAWSPNHWTTREILAKHISEGLVPVGPPGTDVQ